MLQERPILIFGGIGGVLWGIAYLLIIRRSFMERTFGVPIVAMCANIAWEFIFSFLYPSLNPGQRIINVVWFGLDAVIIYTYLRFGRRDFTPLLPGKLFYPMPFIMMAIAFSLIVTTVPEFNDLQGQYTAFIIDFMMAVLFVVFLLQRGNVRGQSLYVALFKWLGSAGYAVVFYWFHPTSHFLTVLYILTFAFNGCYAWLIYRALRAEGINPWRRF